MRMLVRLKEKMAATIISPPSASFSLSSTYARLELRSKCAWTSRNVIQLGEKRARDGQNYQPNSRSCESDLLAIESENKRAKA